MNPNYIRLAGFQAKVVRNKAIYLYACWRFGQTRIWRVDYCLN